MRNVIRIIAGVLLALLGILVVLKLGAPVDVDPSVPSAGGPAMARPTGRAQGSPAAESREAAVGFTSRNSWLEHFEKHGAEFDARTKEDYLRAAQALRDAPAGGSVLEAVRPDGTISRFDRQSGAFLAFNADRTIRTFFKPNDGVRYFERQIDREH